jgi:hypothetical protein
VASYGILYPGKIDLLRPAAWIRARTLALRQQPVLFGRRVTMLEFLCDQLGLRGRRGV